MLEKNRPHVLYTQGRIKRDNMEILRANIFGLLPLQNKKNTFYYLKPLSDFK